MWILDSICQVFRYHCRLLGLWTVESVLQYLWWGEKDSGRLPGSWALSPNESSLHHYRLTWSLDACLRLLMGWWGGVLREWRKCQQRANAELCVGKRRVRVRFCNNNNLLILVQVKTKRVDYSFCKCVVRFC